MSNKAKKLEVVIHISGQISWEGDSPEDAVLSLRDSKYLAWYVQNYCHFQVIQQRESPWYKLE